jgi:diaminopimelate epimerase
MTTIEFVKSHGTLNDFVIVFDPDDRLELDSEVVARLCNRRGGIGGDGLIRIVRQGLDDGGDPVYFMDYRNADGSEAEMCGNGIRCMALYLLRRELVNPLAGSCKIETRAGTKTVSWERNTSHRGKVQWFAVDMGKPSFEFSAVPVDPTTEGVEVARDPKVDQPGEIVIARHPFGAEIFHELPIAIMPVSMGNPHAVILADAEPAQATFYAIGDYVEKHPVFPERTNVEVVWKCGNDWHAFVWERGVGETLSCGTGACAAGVAILSSLGEDAETRKIELNFPGGPLRVTWGDTVILQGPATEVFEGEIEV